MFDKGQKIVYGSEGVYVVEDYTRSPIDKNDQRIFYLLKPLYGPEGNVIFTPADNERINMRAVMTKESAIELISRMPDLPTLEIVHEKRRRNVYKDSITDGDSENYVRLIKTVYERREEQIRNKKRLSEADAEYEKKAKFCLYGELAVSLEIGIDEVEAYITAALSK